MYDESAAPAAPSSDAKSPEILNTNVAKTHGASQIPEHYFWIGHGVGIALVCVAIVCIVFAGYPRSRTEIR